MEFRLLKANAALLGPISREGKKIVESWGIGIGKVLRGRHSGAFKLCGGSPGTLIVTPRGSTGRAQSIRVWDMTVKWPKPGVDRVRFAYCANHGWAHSRRILFISVE